MASIIFAKIVKFVILVFQYQMHWDFSYALPQMCLYVEPVSRSEDHVQSQIKVVSVIYLFIPVSLSVPEMEGIYATGEHPFLVSRCGLVVRR